MDENIPTEEEIADLLSRVQPHPRTEFNQRMETQPWNPKERILFWGGFTPKRAAASLGLVLLFVLGINIFTPSLNTLAQQFAQFFSPSPSSQPITEPALIKTIHPLERFTLSIPEAESIAGFKMKAPSQIPQELELVGATYDELREAIILHYETDANTIVLRISQQYLDPDFQSIGPEAVVEIVEIGTNSGEFVTGGWMIPEVESGVDIKPGQNEPQMVWDANVKLQTLRWADGEFLYEIILAGSFGQPGYLDKDGLIALANKMR